jgi:hypothetical protein
LKVNQLQGHWNGRRSGRFGLISLNIRVFEEHVVVPKIAMENASHWTATFYRVDKNNLGQTFINQLCKPFCKLVAKKRKTGSKMIKSIENTYIRPLDILRKLNHLLGKISGNLDGADFIDCFLLHKKLD